MNKHLTKYLVEDLGYKSYRYVSGKYIPNNINDYSTMVEGGLDVRYIKDSDETKQIIFGLHEKGKPSTLISPRPKITLRVKDSEGKIVCVNQQFDDAMNVCLREELPENIYKAMYDKSIKFNYDKI